MIIDQAIARPYAEAAFGYAKEQNQVPQWQDFLQAMAQLFEVETIKVMVNNPFVDQKDLIHAILDGLTNQLNESQANFLKLLAENRRLSYLFAVCALYQMLADQLGGVRHVDVISAFALSDASLKALQQKLSEKYQKQMIVHVAVDPALIGGMIIRMGDHVLDGSVKGQLQQLNQAMLK